MTTVDETERHSNICPHCGAKMQAYWQRLSPGLVQTLVKFRHAVLKKGENKIHVPKEVDFTKNEYNNFQRLRYHALVAKVKDKEGKRLSAYWLITRRGNQFCKGEATIPEKVKTFRNKIVEYGDKKVKINQVIDQTPYWDKLDDFMDFQEGDKLF
jgi:hypothetical protein